MAAMSDLETILNADLWLRDMGVIGKAQLNNLILTSMCACPELKNIAFDYPKNNPENKITATLYLGRWKYLTGSRQKLVDKLANLFNDYMPQYTFNFKFAIYGSKVMEG